MKIIWVIMREDRYYVKTRSVWQLDHVIARVVQAYESIEDAVTAWSQLEENEIENYGLIKVLHPDTDHPVKVKTIFWLHPPVTLT